MTFEEARRLCHIAYAPQEGDLPLCFRGRIARARHMIVLEKDPDKRNSIHQGIDALRKMKMDAEKAATGAAIQWASENLDKDSSAPFPPECPCEGCEIAELQAQAIHWLGVAGEHFHNLLVPAKDIEPIQPLLFGLIDHEKEAEGLAEVKAWVSALKNYSEIKDMLNEPVDWAKIYGKRDYNE